MYKHTPDNAECGLKFIFSYRQFIKHTQCKQIIFTCYSLNIVAARKEVDEESITPGDSDHPIVIGDSPKKKSVGYEGCGPRIVKARIGAKCRFNETPKLQTPKSKRCRVLVHNIRGRQFTGRVRFNTSIS